jgi:hypothetical protein
MRLLQGCGLAQSVVIKKWVALLLFSGEIHLLGELLMMSLLFKPRVGCRGCEWATAGVKQDCETAGGSVVRFIDKIHVLGESAVWVSSNKTAPYYTAECVAQLADVKPSVQPPHKVAYV